MQAELRLVPAAGVEALASLDASGEAVVRAVAAGGAVAVAGAPGSGKTNLALHLAVTALASGSKVALLSPTRRTAASLRQRLEATVNQIEGQVVMTPVALAMSILNRRADAIAASGQAGAARWASAERPQMVSGADQAAAIASLLEAERSGQVAATPWPPSVPPQALGLAAFRNELRDLMMRAAERGLSPEGLAALGDQQGRPEWVAAAQIFGAYLDGLGLRTAADAGLALDAAAMVSMAATALQLWAEPYEPPAGGVSLRLDPRLRPSWDLVVVDDYQEAGSALAKLLGLLAGHGAQIVLLGCPDLAVQGYRGAIADQLERASDDPPAGFGAKPMVLEQVHRQAGELAGVTGRTCRLIRTRQLGHKLRSALDLAALPGPGGAGQNALVTTARGPGKPGGGTGGPWGASYEAATSVLVAGSEAQGVAAVARRLRQRHLLGGVAWGNMAVLTRTGRQVSELRTGLALAGVPAQVPGSEVLSLDQPAARAFLTALSAVSGPTGANWLETNTAKALLTGPIGQMDQVALRRLRRLLRARRSVDDKALTSGELVAGALAGSVDLANLDPDLAAPVAKVAQVMERGRRAVAQSMGAHGVLWELWQASDLAEPWRQAALRGGTDGRRADRNLDAICALFAAAERFDARVVGAGPAGFARYLEGQEVPSDTVAGHAPPGDQVTVATAAAAVGREWDTVVVTGLQSDVWPNTRLRDSLLGAGVLAGFLDGRGQDSDFLERRRAVIDDEARMAVLAVSRAKQHLCLVVVNDTDTSPSAFVDAMVPWPPKGQDENWDNYAERLLLLRQPQSMETPFDLRGLVAQARQEVVERPGSAEAAKAVEVLALLAKAGVPGADPERWAGLAPRSSDEPVFAPGQTVVLSPSKIEALDTCPLRWALEQAGGSPPQVEVATLGSLIHGLAQDYPEAGANQLLAALDQRWASLGLTPGYSASKLRRMAEKMVTHLGQYQQDHRNRLGSEVRVEATFGPEDLRRVEASPGPVLASTTPAGVAKSAGAPSVRVFGSIDRVEQCGQPGAVRLVDYKTGSKLPTGKQAQLNCQLGVYQLAWNASQDSQVAEAALIYLADNGTKAEPIRTYRQPALVNSEDPNWAAELLQRCYWAGTGRQIEASTNENCRNCPVAGCCPVDDQGRQVTA
ncbi:MAG: PD-(D/E)XK nuclease family protein [Micrococcales bacterium]|nr:PD-(D/E)XK nuclease family protein [Micrococcales bacterium]